MHILLKSLLLESVVALKESLTPNDIHKLADSKGIKWDNEPSFLKLTKKLTGKEHLDDLNQAGLKKVKNYLEKQAVSEDLNKVSEAKKRKKRKKNSKISRRALGGYYGGLGWGGWGANSGDGGGGGGGDGGGGGGGE
jgi:hypothetical protein